jgi:hypothetical protein
MSKHEGGAKGKGESTGRPRGWVVFMARFGYAAKGIVYLAIGTTAARAAFLSDEPEGAVGAVTDMLGNPLGTMVVVFVMVGLLGYALWRLVRATANPEHDGVGSRIYSVMTAAVHLAFFGTVASAVLNAERSDDGRAQHWTAIAFSQPLGRWLVFAIAAGFVVNGLWQTYKAITVKLDDDIDFQRMNRLLRWGTLVLARAGMTARGVVFGLIGISVAAAAVQLDASEAHGIGEVLEGVANAPYGQVLLASIASGFMAYGAYELLRAVYRRVRT